MFRIVVSLTTALYFELDISLDVSIDPLIFKLFSNDLDSKIIYVLFRIFLVLGHS